MQKCALCKGCFAYARKRLFFNNNYSGKKAKNAQEAHEAIRPTDINRSPEAVKKYLSTDQNKLYNLIWSRALSSQMVSAKFDRNTITIETEDKNTVCKTSGSVLKFDGFLKVYKPSNIDEDEIINGINLRPELTHIVLTGRGASEKLIDSADLVTEMKLIVTITELYASGKGTVLPISDPNFRRKRLCKQSTNGSILYVNSQEKCFFISIFF